MRLNETNLVLTATELHSITLDNYLRVKEIHHRTQNLSADFQFNLNHLLSTSMKSANPYLRYYA